MSQIFIVLGRGGSGKGTQVKLLIEKFGLEHIGSGELLRERARSRDFTGQKTDLIIKQGKLVPTSLIFMLWINKLEQLKSQKTNNFSGIIFDGSPRKLNEAELLEESLKFYEWDENIKVLIIDISREEAFNRLAKRRQCAQCGRLIPYIGQFKDLQVCDKCGGALEARPDDTSEGINQRLDWFEKEVIPVIDFYKKIGRDIINIDGEQLIENVHKDILKKIQ